MHLVEVNVTDARKALKIRGFRQFFVNQAVLDGGTEPLPISEAWGHIADESGSSNELEEGIEQTNLRKLPLCQVIVKNPLGQLWLVGKDILQGPRNGR